MLPFSAAACSETLYIGVQLQCNPLPGNGYIMPYLPRCLCALLPYLNANLIVKAKASGTKLMSGRKSSSGFQSKERFTGALVNL
jgi:hypothetical protein